MNFIRKFSNYLLAAIASLFQSKQQTTLHFPNFNRLISLFQHFTFSRAIRKFQTNYRGTIGLMEVGMAIIGLVIGLMVAAELLPGAIVDITCSTSYAGAPTAVVTMMTTVLGIVIAAAIILLILKHARD